MQQRPFCESGVVSRSLKQEVDFTKTPSPRVRLEKVVRISSVLLLTRTFDDADPWVSADVLWNGWEKLGDKKPGNTSPICPTAAAPLKRGLPVPTCLDVKFS
jgi:hypothetical protein